MRHWTSCSPGAVSLALLLGMGCAAPSQTLTYDRFDRRTHTYVNDTAGFAMTLPEDVKVTPQPEAPPALLLWGFLPIPSGTELSLRAVGRDLGLLVEITRVPASTPLEALQPAFFKAYESSFRQLRYKEVSVATKQAHGLDYVEWVYRLSSPDLDRMVVEGMFQRAGYAVRVRALTDSNSFETVKTRIQQVMGSLTAVDTAASGLGHAASR